ncbi:acyl carrier protein [Parahalioglobus pacificus]|uniref:Acyl carrier protein n=1 Tax=Parahalioglobus pacificus TaxID=930806 RepID=A0A918XIG6_9GAMM|nr:acyl carrier protein [Halioglobus pacificus]GHD33726.1 hypothetical protein GCM10007053_18470 [Halioglobus pacificus]
MENREKLKELMLDILLIDEDEFSFELKREDVETWDSLGVVSVAVGIQDTFGYHPSTDEATALDSVDKIIELLESNGIQFEQ